MFGQAAIHTRSQCLLRIHTESETDDRTLQQVFGGFFIELREDQTSNSFSFGGTLFANTLDDHIARIT